MVSTSVPEPPKKPEIVKKEAPRKSQKINIKDYGYDQNTIAQARKSVDILLKNPWQETEEEPVETTVKEPSSKNEDLESSL